jgi:hypothetical protein
MNYIAVFTQLLPVAAALRAGRGLGPALRIIVVLLLLMFTQDCVMWWMKTHQLRNLWVRNLTMPLFTALVLWALSLWQVGAVSRLTLRLAIPLFVAVWVGILVLLRPGLNQYNPHADVLQAVLLVCVSAYTLVSGALRAEEPVWRQPWFWVTAGLLLTYGGSAALAPVSVLLEHTSREQHLRVYAIFSSVDIVAHLLMTGGMLSAWPRPISQESFSPRRSWRPS